MSAPTYITKSLTTASSTSVGSISSAGVVTLSCATLDTARRITIVGASALTPVLTLTGLNQGGNVFSETVTPSTVIPGVATTTQDFLKLTSVTLATSMTSSGGALIGTTTQGGTPWYMVDTVPNPTNIIFNLDITSPSTVVAASFEYTFDQPVYNPVSNTWAGPSPTTGPRPTISSLGSTVTLDATGLINFPIAGWRVTVTSTSSAAGSVFATILQSGN